MLRIGYVDYINLLPIMGGILLGEVPSPYHFVAAAPTELNRRLTAGELDLSFVSTAAFLENKEELELLPPYCIAAEDRVESVFLYYKGEFTALEGATVFVTPDTASSVSLLQVLAAVVWNLTLEVVVDADPFSAFTQCTSPCGALMIGDLALEQKHTPRIDLAHAWHSYTSLPFVFAVLAARRPLSAEAEEVVALLEESYAWGFKNRASLLSLACKKMGWPATLSSRERLARYYNLLHYHLNDKDYESVALFEHYLSSTLAGAVL